MLNQKEIKEIKKKIHIEIDDELKLDNDIHFTKIFLMIVTAIERISASFEDKLLADVHGFLSETKEIQKKLRYEMNNINSFMARERITIIVNKNREKMMEYINMFYADNEESGEVNLG